jgi:hypothetical protein
LQSAQRVEVTVNDRYYIMRAGIRRAGSTGISVQADEGEPLSNRPLWGTCRCLHPPLMPPVATMTNTNGQVAAGGDELPLDAYPLGELTTFSEEDVARMPVLSPGPVTLQNRQGVFVHAFRCSIYDLEFMVFSWRANRHRTLLPAHPRSLRRGPHGDRLRDDRRRR